MNERALRVLCAKEVRHLMPLLVIFACLTLLGLLGYFVFDSPLRASWASLSFVYASAPDIFSAVIYIGTGAIAAYLLFPHESDQGTLGFLWTLPVSRRWVLGVKLAAVLLMLLVLTTWIGLLSAFLVSLGRNSVIAGEFSWNSWLLQQAMVFGMTLIGFGYGLLMSFFRRIGVVAGVVLIVILVQFARDNPAARFLDITMLAAVELHGFDATPRFGTWAFHGLGALACMVAGGLLWIGHADTHQTVRAWMRRSIGVRVLAFSVGAFVLLSLLAEVPTLNWGARSGGATLGFSTKHFEVRYFAEDADAAGNLLDHADSDFERALELLGAGHDAVIVADLTEAAQNHLGIAGWNKIRMDRRSLYELPLARHVLLHEAVHVIVSAQADQRLGDRAGATAFFNEGVAEWVSYQLLDLPQTRRALRVLAVTAWQRLELEFVDLASRASFDARFDPNAIYALGEAWVSVLAETCGRDAPGNAIRALAEAAQRPGGALVLWSDALRSFGCDLGVVNGRFEQWVQASSDLADAVPRIEGFLASTDPPVFVLRRLGTEPAGYMRVQVRVRPGPGSSMTRWQTFSGTAYPGETIRITPPPSLVPTPRFQYQFGVVFEPGERAYFGRWRDASRP